MKKRNFELKPSLPSQFVVMNTSEEYAGVRERCTVENLQKAVSDIEGLTVEVIDLNETGSYTDDLGDPDSYKLGVTVTDLPSYYRVTLKKQMAGGHVATIWVYLPLVWNERFLGLTGGGTQPRMPYTIIGLSGLSSMTVALQNHFACAETNCGIGPYDAAWGFKPGTNELDWDHLRQWGYEAAHIVAVVGKRITEVVYGRKPEYSYLNGTSAGGRTTLGELQRYPEDYDGYYANCPATPWARHLLNQTWPLIVMINEKHPISVDKLNAFYNGMLREHGMEQQGYLTDCYFSDFDPYKMVGEKAGEEIITEEDARVMRKIYDGPKYRDGRRMYGCDLMGPAIRYWNVLLLFTEDGSRPYTSLAECGIQTFSWALRRPGLKWEEITYEAAERIYEWGVSEGRDLDNLDPDLRRLRDLGRKVIYTHASGDFCCSLATSLRYYNDILHTTFGGREDEMADMARFYVAMSGGHNNTTHRGELMAYPDAFAALIRWVEDGIAPEELPAMKWDFDQELLTYSGRREQPYSTKHPENYKVLA